ncbi:glycosyltransferase family 4 protein [Planomicrobium sp. CPCC 101079]|uniref:glycosyltransferase family 4 protein n=1 Tax=Planomicrobium sp. CPCC 101079 TaxID=2599618 RepID=UPI0011B734A8|nr:glycosyltransferase family 4 protein [Planomicrobium sp. CPCC 101079]TWT03629.1 glycosyltransferase family 4 protein [Planomicrobium sp. CPCC 101079]
MRLKICYLSGSIIPSKNANSVHVMKMCQAFVENGHNVSLYARKSDERIEDVFEYYGVSKKFNVVHNEWPSYRGIGGMLYANQVRKNILKASADIFYGRELYSLLAVSGFGKPLVYEAHKPPATLVGKRLEAMLLQKKNFKHLTVISEALKNEYLRIYPFLTPEKIVVAHDGADLPKEDQLKNNEPKNNVLMSSNEGLNVGYIGHLYPGKGMEVISELARKMPQVNFHVIGGKEEDLKYWKQKCEGLENLFFYGFVPNGELCNYYSSIDIFLAPYQNKVAAAGGKGDISKWMSPLKIFEYMSYGKTMVASDLPVLKEVLTHERNSILCNPTDIDEWVEAILLLQNNPDIRKSIAEKAFDDLALNFTWKLRGERVLG